MMNFILVALGGAIGSMLRYGVGLLCLRGAATTSFPWATLSVNLLGGLLIGIMTGLLATLSVSSQETRLLMVVGVLGGFTTFSAFSLDAVLLFEKGQTATALLYILASVIGALTATALGLWATKVIT